MVSLLNKLGKKLISQMSDAEIISMVEADRTRRSQERALARVAKIVKDARAANQPKQKEKTLDNLGFSPALIAKLRASGRSDSEIILTLKQKGLI